MHRILLLFLICLCCPVRADTVIATRTLPARSVLMPGDLSVVSTSLPGYAETFEQVVGQETAVTLFANSPIRLSQLVPPAIIERNQMVTLVFNRGGLEIETDGRALDRGGIGVRIRAMNLSSRNTVFGVIGIDGRIQVGAQP